VRYFVIGTYRPLLKDNFVVVLAILNKEQCFEMAFSKLSLKKIVAVKNATYSTEIFLSKKRLIKNGYKFNWF
jgi:3-methyladenine DNA glycosylase Tag